MANTDHVAQPITPAFPDMGTHGDPSGKEHDRTARRLLTIRELFPYFSSWKRLLRRAVELGLILLAYALILGGLTVPEVVGGAVGFLLLWAVLGVLQSTRQIDRPLPLAALLIVYTGLIQVLVIGGDEVPVAFWVICLGGGTVFVVGLTRFWEHWRFWRTQNQATSTAVIGALGTFAMLIAVFSVATSVLVKSDIAQTKPALKDEVLMNIEAHYAWHFLDAIPVLDVAKTVNWKLDHKLTDVWSGLLLLVFKILVIIPVIGVVKHVYVSRQAPA